MTTSDSTTTSTGSTTASTGSTTASTGSTTASTDPSTGSGDDRRAATTPLQRSAALLGGLSLAAAPLLIMAGVVTSPPQDSPTTADYIESLARDPFITSVSATLFHYGWIALALGVLAGTGLVAGRRGSLLTLIGALLSALTAVQISGLLLMDWFNSSLGRNLPLTQAAGVTDDIYDPSLTVWLWTGKVAIVMPLVFFAGLARARVLSWWLVPLSVLPMVVGPMVGGLVPGTAGLVLGTVVGLAAFAPAFVVAAKLIRRGRSGG